MHSSQWTYASAADLAQALREGKASAVELARDAIKRIESADAALNAMCVKTYETALAEPLKPMRGSRVASAALSSACP